MTLIFQNFGSVGKGQPFFFLLYFFFRPIYVISRLGLSCAEGVMFYLEVPNEHIYLEFTLLLC